jgi:tRNA-dihydrouridine synthase
VINGGFSDV